ncbi:hypothetical protein E2C01_085831 [Portunus trituberculatus]|uniref:Uncharacterized protein n=1 Tax=Portunus trituberculatus TaxID=210409 RepID=A0A5B7JCZ5_PORTR|nr:hypothetical protein [Portunus trituberculatus]
MLGSDRPSVGGLSSMGGLELGNRVVECTEQSAGLDGWPASMMRGSDRPGEVLGAMVDRRAHLVPHELPEDKKSLVVGVGLRQEMREKWKA